MSYLNNTSNIDESYVLLMFAIELIKLVSNLSCIHDGIMLDHVKCIIDCETISLHF